jgi:membrane associated rhomboid family serine protease
MSAPELSVVCKSCGSEVSPYVTECPYCGHRLRKRAPKLEREGDEIKVHESRREKRRRLKRERALERELTGGGGRRRRLPRLEAGERPLATLATLLVAAVLIVLLRAVPLFPGELGALVGPLDGQFWRCLTAPFVFDDLGYLIVAGGAIAIFGIAVERRLGTISTGVLILATGALGVLAADVFARALDEFPLVAGGNGVALGLAGAWLMLVRGEHRGQPLASGADLYGAVTVVVVLLLLPLVEQTADPVAGIVGGLVGIALGRLAAARQAGAGG